MITSFPRRISISGSFPTRIFPFTSTTSNPKQNPSHGFDTANKTTNNNHTDDKWFYGIYSINRTQVTSLLLTITLVCGFI